MTTTISPRSQRARTGLEARRAAALRRSEQVRSTSRPASGTAPSATPSTSPRTSRRTSATGARARTTEPEVERVLGRSSAPSSVSSASRRAEVLARVARHQAPTIWRHALSALGPWRSRPEVPVTLRRSQRPPTLAFYVILVVVTLLTTIGLVMVLSASSITSFHDGESPWGTFIKQAMWAGVGTVAALVAYRIPYNWWRQWSGTLLVISMGLMLLPFVPGLGREVSGARAWIDLGGASFQPAEVFKLAVLLRCADLLARQLEREPDSAPSLGPCMIVLGLAGVLCVGQGDLGAAIVFAAMVASVAFIAGVRLRRLGMVLGGGAALMLAFIAASPRRGMRWFAFLDLEGNRADSGYQVWQSVLSIANGGPTGVGVGAGTGKWGYVPLAHSDFIFAIVAEELGIIGVVAVLGGFAALTVAAVQVALAAADRFGMLVAGGVAAWFGVQALINVGGVTGLIPVTGLTLPLIADGGSSLVASLAAAGLLANIARNTR